MERYVPPRTSVPRGYNCGVFYHQDHRALWGAGAASWLAGKYLNSRPGREVIDEVSGERVIEKPNHHLMFIKMEYWGPIYLAIGLVVLIAGMIKR